MKLKNLAIGLGLISTMGSFAQEAQVDQLDALNQRITLLEDAKSVSSKLKITGYIQAQWQSSQLDSLGNKTNDMKSGIEKNGPESAAGVADYNRFGIRRGRLKATYEDFGCQGVIEFNMDEAGIKTKSIYVNVLDPWIGCVGVKGGVFDRPFGYEVAYSSSKLESPERSRITQILFPDENDLGTMLTLQAPKTSPWTVLKLEAGLFAGNAINKDYKSKKDFMSHLTYIDGTPTFKYGLGVSLYSGSILQTNANVYTMNAGAFTLNNTASNLNSYAKRNYLGFDGQFSIASEAGLSSLRAEYITGTQPGSSSSTASPNGFDPTTATAGDTYIRKFQGGYINFVQDILDTKHSIVVKLDWYDPNTDVKGTQVGTASKTGKADMAYTTIGLGYYYRMNNNVKITAYYDVVNNEGVSVKGFTKNVKDNLLTLRIQYKF